MKLSLVTVTLLAAGVVFAGNKVERKVLVEFPCGIQKVGEIDVTSGLGKLLSVFDIDGDGFVTDYCDNRSIIHKDEHGNITDIQVIHYYKYDNCTKIEEIERTKKGEVVRNQIVYSRKLKESADLGTGCQQAALVIKDLIEMNLDKASYDPDSKQADVLNKLGRKDRVIVNK